MKTATMPASSTPDRTRAFTTVSGRPVRAVYGPGDVASSVQAPDASAPGEFPYTRGIHPTGYRGRLWTMRQFAGFGTPEETNARYRQDRKSTRLNSSHIPLSRMPSSA